MNLPRNLLDRPAEEMARLITLSFISQVSSARRRLKAEDPEGLHDFRVALRRIRTSLRMFDHELQSSVSRRNRKLLRRLARATRDSRDLEVHREWVASQEEALTARQRAGVAWLVRRLTKAKNAADRKLDRVVRSDFRRMRRQLRKELRSYHLTVRLDRVQSGNSAARSMGRQVQQLAGDLETRIGSIHSITQEQAAHEARIQVKRLRYILEPLQGQVEGVSPVIASLKALQDVLGDLHDADVYGAQLAHARDDAERQQLRRTQKWKGREPDPDARARSIERDPRAGLVALSRRLASRKEEAFRRLESGWLGGASEDFFNQVNELARGLIQGDQESREIERKYLLRQMPPAVRVAPASRIEQGWLPGVRINERVRRVTDGGEEHRYRTIKAGAGLSRLEVEEEVPAPLFDTLWPLTAGRRVLKSRHKVQHQGLTWEIDEFADRDLVLAEVELPTEDTPVEPPEWLKAYVVREVTGEDGFTNVNLAQ
jgi:CHAD domain-containing protein/CYTH domain-containing protein